MKEFDWDDFLDEQFAVFVYGRKEIEKFIEQVYERCPDGTISVKYERGGALYKMGKYEPDEKDIVRNWSDYMVNKETCNEVNHPNHYNQSGIECIEAMEALAESVGHPAEAILATQTLKYMWRYNHKGKPQEDLQKAKWYLERLIKKVSEKNEA